MDWLTLSNNFINCASYPAVYNSAATIYCMAPNFHETIIS